MPVQVLSRGRCWSIAESGCTVELSLNCVEILHSLSMAFRSDSPVPRTWHFPFPWTSMTRASAEVSSPGNSVFIWLSFWVVGVKLWESAQSRATSDPRKNWVAGVGLRPSPEWAVFTQLLCKYLTGLPPTLYCLLRMLLFWSVLFAVTIISSTEPGAIK